MDITCNFCAALHWIDERVSTSPPSNPCFEACCKHSNINLPLFQPLPEYLYNLLEFHSTPARQFRERLCAYNTALAFMSINYTITDCSVAWGGPNCFQIYSKLYYLQGLLEPPINVALWYAQLYFYDPSYAIDIWLQACPNTQLDAIILQCLTAMLSEVQNPFITLY